MRHKDKLERFSFIKAAKGDVTFLEVEHFGANFQIGMYTRGIIHGLWMFLSLQQAFLILETFILGSVDTCSHPPASVGPTFQIGSTYFWLPFKTQSKAIKKG